MKEVAGRVGGKGGGSRDFAQGGGFDEARLEEAFAAAEELLSREN
jgi:alanyl-tRNA synthetase